MPLAHPIRPWAANCVSIVCSSFSSMRQNDGRTVVAAMAAANRLLYTRETRCVFYIQGAIRTPLPNPIRWPFLIKRGDAFTRFGRFAGLHVIIERKIDIFLHRTPPEFFY